MIKTFARKSLKVYWERGETKGLPQESIDKIRRRLMALNAATKATDMNLPGFGFHELKGDRKGTYAVSVTGNYRITFKFDSGDAMDVSLEDYH